MLTWVSEQIQLCDFVDINQVCTWQDFGICTQLLQAQREGSEALQIPIFGVCLGHQGIALIFGGKVCNKRERV